jgi:predicted anti-sigma-YlaC factor YlaD
MERGRKAIAGWVGVVLGVVGIVLLAVGVARGLAVALLVLALIGTGLTVGGRAGAAAGD